MNTSELRIGNYIGHVNYFHKKMHKVIQISNNHVNVETGDTFVSISSDFIMPMPLTEEILLKCGFANMEQPNEWKYKIRIQALTLFVRCNAGHLYMEFGGIYLGDMIKTVHHLQNFCQTFGRELNPTF